MASSKLIQLGAVALHQAIEGVLLAVEDASNQLLVGRLRIKVQRVRA